MAAATCVVAASPPRGQEKTSQPNASQEPGTAKGDLHGDALPQGALARFGTLRWRHAEAVSYVAFLPDGKSVLTAGLDSTLRIWERETGKEIRRFTVPAAPQPAQPGRVRFLNAWGVAGRDQPVASLAPDGKTLAAVVFGTKIQLWEVATGKELRNIPGPQNGVASLLFAPDSKTLAAAGGDRIIYILDAETGKEIRQLKPKQPMGAVVRIGVGGALLGGAGMAFSPDGKALATAEQEFDQAQGKVSSYVKITDVETGNELRRIDTPQAGTSTFAYSPDNKILAIASGNVVQFREPETGQEIRQFAAAGATALLFSPNSKTLAIKSLDQMIQLLETASGKELHKLGDAAAQVGNNLAVLRFGGFASRDLAFSADGKIFATGSGNTLRMWDTATGKEKPLTEGHRGPVSAVSISADGKTLISRGADNVMRRWDVNTAEELGQFREPPGTLSVAISPDGRTIAFGTNDAVIRLHDATTGKETKRLKGHANGTGSIVFSPNGKTLASHGLADNTIRLHDAIDGAELRQIVLQTDNAAGPGAFVARNPYLGVGALTLAFSADSQTLVAQQPPNIGQLVMVGGQPQPGAQSATTVRMWDVATGKDVRKFTLPPERGLGSIALSPDGRILATENADQTISLWEIASGKERRQLGKPVTAGQPGPGVRMVFAGGGGLGGIGRPVTSGSTLAFSPDGTLLACKGLDHSICMWEVAHGKEIGQFKGHDGAVATVAFTPNGKTLATGSSDTTVLLWNVAGLKREPTPPALELQPADVAALWTDLISDDAGKAFQGILKLTQASKQSLPLLRDRVKPAVPVDPKKVAKLIGDLDSEDFDQRSAAAEELEKLGELAVPSLQNVLIGQPTLETRRRAEQLLARLTGGALTPEQIRLVRAIEVLERTATPEARQLLDTLAMGAPGALATRQSQAVLSRLGK